MNLINQIILDTQQEFLQQTTHIICEKPKRSEKFLAACASGKGMLLILADISLFDGLMTFKIKIDDFGIVG